MIVNDWYEFDKKYGEKKIKVKTIYGNEYTGILYDIESDEEEIPADILMLESEEEDIPVDVKNIISIEIIE